LASFENKRDNSQTPAAFCSKPLSVERFAFLVVRTLLFWFVVLFVEVMACSFYIYKDTYFMPIVVSFCKSKQHFYKIIIRGHRRKRSKQKNEHRKNLSDKKQSKLEGNLF